MNEIYTRISVRKFKSDPVEKGKITAVLRAAMQAPPPGTSNPGSSLKTHGLLRMKAYVSSFWLASSVLS